MSIVPRDPFQPVTSETLVELERRWPNGEKLKWAWRLARDVETCAALLRGEPVDPNRIRRDELERAKETKLVQLVDPIEVLT